MNKPLILGTLAFLVIVTLPVLKEFQYLEFLNTPAALGETFAVLAFVAALLERATEVFVFIFRAPGRQIMEQEILCLKDEEAKCMMKKEIEKYKSTTQQYAYLFALIIAALVAASGIRSLEPHFAYPVLEDSQLQYFRIADVLITSGLIAGGTEGIHRAAKAFYGFMDFLKTKTATP